MKGYLPTYVPMYFTKEVRMNAHMCSSIEEHIGNHRASFSGGSLPPFDEISPPPLEF